jgi:hypothetical protein
MDEIKTEETHVEEVMPVEAPEVEETPAAE